MRRRAVVGGLGATVAALGCAQANAEPNQPNSTGSMTQDRLAEIRARSGAPAMMVGVDRRGGARTILADGVRAAGKAEAVTPADAWHLGSIGKSMTATLVARLVEAGAFAWTDTVGAVLGAPVATAPFRDATLLHLLSHRAGLIANLPITQFLQLERQSDDPRAERAKFIDFAAKAKPVGPLGGQMVYSNVGFVVAGAMVEARAGLSWEAAMRREVFEPLGLTSAGFGAPAGPNPLGHSKAMFGQARKPHLGGVEGGTNDNPAAMGPAGRIHMTPADLLTYLAAHRDRTPFLKAETWATLHSPPFGGDYALGWVVRPDGLWHNGSNTLWYAEVRFDPQAGIAVCAAANDGHLAKSQPAVAQALAMTAA